MGINPLETPTGQPLHKLDLMLTGLKKSHPSTTRKRMPITYPVLVQLCAHVSECQPRYNAIMLRAVFSVAFFGFLRCGEFTANSNFDHELHLCVGDVTFDTQEAKVTIHLKTSKTDPFRKGIDIVLFPNQLTVCPYHNLFNYINIRGPSAPKDPLFITANKQVLTRTLFLDMLKTVLHSCGLNTATYTGHSFRIGAATSAANGNVEDHMIKTLGRWSSDCYQRYIRTSTGSIKAAQISMATENQPH